jgi:Histidine kinase-, DNA gyrase B-, and HSP90-like ATPase
MSAENNGPSGVEPGGVDRFHGEIKVASRIVDYLSSGLYHSPAACLKELINNAYDADARNVHVFVKPDADRIVIQDDGVGMSRKEFETHFQRISESHKRDDSSVTRLLNRPKVGKIGIGFIAANEICEVMEIFSTKEGSEDLLHVTINFSEIRQPIEERRRGGTDVAKADYEGEILTAEREEHYTHIFLEQVRGEAREILAGATSQLRDSQTRSLYGKSEKSVVSALKDVTLNSWKDFDLYSETMLAVALNVPVRYADGWMPQHLHGIVKELERDVSKLKFDVFYDGTPLRKPVVYVPGERKCLAVPFEFDGDHVSAKGYFYAQHGSVKPQELHGVLLRIRNAAVSEFDPSFWGFTPSVASLIQRWVSGEIWADDRLEDAMNIDRRTLREAHPAYVELRDALHVKLRAVFDLAKKQLYDSGSSERKATKATEAKREIQRVVDQAVAGAKLPSNSAKALKKAWDSYYDTVPSHKVLLKKYSVPEFYSIVIEVANDVLTPKQLDVFLRSLTDRLGK